MNPVNSVHFFDESALTNDCADEVKRERGGILPIARHHATDGTAFFWGRIVDVDRIKVGFIRKSSLDRRAHKVHGSRIAGFEIGGNQKVHVKLTRLGCAFDESIRKKARFLEWIGKLLGHTFWNLSVALALYKAQFHIEWS